MNYYIKSKGRCKSLREKPFGNQNTWYRKNTFKNIGKKDCQNFI